MFYIQKGVGSDLVFLHGWGADHKSFAALREYFSVSFRVTAVDFPGFGNSPAPESPFTIFDYCDILKKALASAGIQKADFVCHSFGGRVGILMAALYPETVNKLILADAAGVKPRRGLRYRMKVMRYKIKKFLVRKGLMDKKRLENSGSADYRALSGVMKETFVKVVNCDLTPYLHKISCPSLIISGENDRDTPLYMARKMKKLIPDSGLVVLKDAGHYSFLDKPREFRLIAENFLGERKDDSV